MLASVQIEHEVRQCPLQLRAQVPVHGEASAGKFRSAFEVKNAQLLSEFPVRLGSEIEFGWSAPAPNFNIVFGSLAHGHTLVGQIGDARQKLAQAGFKVRCDFFPLLDLLAEILGFGHLGGGILAALFELCDLLRGAVAPRLHGLGFGDGVPALSIDFEEVLQHLARIHTALAQLFFDQRQIVANEVEIKHGS